MRLLTVIILVMMQLILVYLIEIRRATHLVPQNITNVIDILLMEHIINVIDILLVKYYLFNKLVIIISSGKIYLHVHILMD